MSLILFNNIMLSETLHSCEELAMDDVHNYGARGFIFFSCS